MSEPTTSIIEPGRALDVLRQLEPQIRGIDPDHRAFVGLRAAAEDHVELVDVTLREDGVLDAAGADGLVVVTNEEVGDGDDVVCLTQLLCVLPDGTEVGISRVDGHPRARAWRTDQDETDAAEDLRPRDVTANAARRAFGLPSLVAERLPVAELLGRTWLIAVAGEALRRFDTDDGPRDVEIDELTEAAGAPLLGGLVTASDPLPSWDAIHAHAAEGRLELGPFTVDATHAAWLDVDGLAQVLDTTLPPAGDLLDQLSITSDDRAMAWALTTLLDRGWHHPQ